VISRKRSVTNPLLRRRRTTTINDWKRSGSVLGAPLGLQDLSAGRRHQPRCRIGARSSHSPGDVRSSGSIGKWWKNSHELFKNHWRFFEAKWNWTQWFDLIGSNPWISKCNWNWVDLIGSNVWVSRNIVGKFGMKGTVLLILFFAYTGWIDCFPFLLLFTVLLILFFAYTELS